MATEASTKDALLRVLASSGRALRASSGEESSCRQPSRHRHALPLIVPFAYFHVAGGLDIKPKIKDFHDLQSTYRDGLIGYAQAATSDSVDLRKAEDFWLVEEYAAELTVSELMVAAGGSGVGNG